MADKFTYDTANKLFVMKTADPVVLDATEFYSDAKLDWKDDNALNKFRFPIASIGGQDIGGGQSISPYYSLLYGWRLQFAPADQQVTILGNIITAEGDPPFVDNVGMYHHTVQYTVTSNSLTVGLEADIAQIPTEVWNFLLEGDEKAFEMFRLVRAAVVGRTAGAATSNIRFKSRDGLTDRIDATISNDDRTVVTTDPS